MKNNPSIVAGLIFIRVSWDKNVAHVQGIEVMTVRFGGCPYLCVRLILRRARLPSWLSSPPAWVKKDVRMEKRRTYASKPIVIIKICQYSLMQITIDVSLKYCHWNVCSIQNQPMTRICIQDKRKSKYVPPAKSLDCHRHPKQCKE